MSHSHTTSQNQACSCQHEVSAQGCKQHEHEKSVLVGYIIGIITFLVGFFISSAEIRNGLFLITIAASGYHIILEGFSDTFRESKKNKKFMPNVHLLMALAAIGAAAIGDFNEGALLILIFAGAHFLEEYAEGQSRREITNLLNLNPTEARLVLENGEVEKVSISSVVIGNILKVLPGDQVPTDGKIISGFSDINEAAINGESMPKEKSVGDEVFGGTMNGQGAFLMEVTKDSSETVFAQIIALVDQSQNNLSKTATTIQKIEPIYVKTVLLLVPLFILLAPTIFGWDWYTSFYRGMVMLISASPCALAASAIPATLSALSNLAKRGILFKGGAYLSNFSSIKVAAFDKTGTLTQGKPEVTDVYFVDETKKTDWQKIILAMEKQANHPLAVAIINHFPTIDMLSLAVESEIGNGLMASYSGKEYQLSKASNFTVVPTAISNKVELLQNQGKTVILFSEETIVVGLIAVMDLPNPKAQEVIDYLKQQEIKTVMITGDSQNAGESIGKMLQVDKVIGNVLPADKAQVIKSLIQQYGETAMVGDGINDAPALVEASVGFAMGEGSDVAIDAGDAVIMKNDLTRFAYAYKVSKKLNKIVWQNMIFSMLIVLLLVSLNLFGKVDIGLGVFAHEGSTILVILNGLRMLVPVEQKIKE